MKKVFWHLLGMMVIGLVAFGLTFFVNKFIWEYTNLLDSAGLAGLTAMICYLIGIETGKSE